MSNVIQISIWPRGLINCFLIKGKRKHILIDTGLPGSEQKIFSQLEQHQIRKEDIGLIIITHGHIDHFGSAGKIKKMLDIPILAHKGDIESYSSGQADISTLKTNKPQWELFKLLIKDQKVKGFEPDILLDKEESYRLDEWGINGKVLYTPGHTPGSLSVILDSGEAVIMDMMASGILLGGVMFKSRIKHPPFHDNRVVLKDSFYRLLNEGCEKYYLGHGGPVNKAQILRYYSTFLKS